MSIVRDLRTFSRVDVARPAPVDVTKPLEWAARIVAGEIAPRARLIRITPRCRWSAAMNRASARCS